ncbi:MAG: class I SAM-dependent methyltransferase [Bacteriovoracaceae bacterium]
MTNIPEIKPGQSIELLKELHILTRDGKLNQDTRRKLKQVYHLYHFIEPLLIAATTDGKDTILVDHGAGKSYLGFILYDLFFKQKENGQVIGIEFRPELIQKSRELAAKLGFRKMKFLNETVADSIDSKEVPAKVDIVTALHACDTATDDAIKFGLEKKAKFMVLVPCCQAEVATELRKVKGKNIGKSVLTEIYRHPIHTREFGSHLTNVLRCLELESMGYQVTVTELIGWEHSMKNELIIAEYKNLPGEHARKRMETVLNEFDLSELKSRFIRDRQ